MKPYLCALLLLAAPVAWADHAPAEEAATFSAMVEHAELILAGTVTQTEAQPSTDGRTIYTFITLGDLDVLDGEYTGSTFTLRQDGGEYVDAAQQKVRGMGIPGLPEFEPGQRVVLFIKKNTSNVCPLVGWFRGAFRVKKDGQGREKLFAWRSERELAGVQNDALQLKSEGPPRPSIQVMDDDPTANALRLRHEQEEQARRERIDAQVLTLRDFKHLVKKTAKELKDSGRKKPRKALSASPLLDRAERRVAPVKPRL